MTHFRLRWQKLGGHVHVHVWSGTSRETTHGRNGNLVFRENEWDDFVSAVTANNGIDVDIVPQDAPIAATP